MLITMTGLRQGAVYNANGTNITEAPNGTQNNFVGSYCYDFSGLNGTNPALYTNELSVIISDGRISERTQDDADSLEDLDEYNDDEDAQEDTDGFDRRGHTTTVTQVSAEFRLGNPTYKDVWVLNAIGRDTAEPSDADATNAVLSDQQFDLSLQDWLDNQDANILEADSEVDVWWGNRSYLRWSLHWALFKVKLAQPAGEAVDDDLYQAGLDVLPGVVGAQPATPALEWAPYGLLSAFGTTLNAGDANGYELFSVPWLRLWDPSKPPITMIRRRHILGLPYSLAVRDQDNPGGVSPADQWEADISMEEGAAIDMTGGRDNTPDVRAEGRELVVRIRATGLKVRVEADELLVLCLQTGRARLTAGNLTSQGTVIGRGYPSRGPLFTLHHHWVTARRRLSRRT